MSEKKMNHIFYISLIIVYCGNNLRNKLYAKREIPA